MKEINLSELKKEMPYKWRVQTCKNYGTTLVAYVDARDDENKFDEVCGPENWQCEYSLMGDQMICRIGVYCNGQWVWKSDGGTRTDIEGEKGLLSDSFKRAAVKWGPGRFLYSLTPIKLPSIDTGRKKGSNTIYAPMHDTRKYGPAQGVPKGILAKTKDDNGNWALSLQIKEVDAYVNKFLKLKPWKNK